jgi:hypothetical protein
VSSSVESFCYAALLKNPKTLAAQLALLTDERRSKIEALMDELRVLTEADRRRRWKGLRRAEAEAKMRDCLQRYGTGFRAFSPQLKIWLCQVC